MNNNLLQKIKSKFKPGELFLMMDLKDKDLTEAALRQELLRLTKRGDVKRFSYGVYYLPGAETPNAITAIELRYIQNDKGIFGFYTGQNYIEWISGRPISLNSKIEIMTNRATSGKKSVYMFSKRFVLRKPYVEITKENDVLNAFLSYITMAPMAEINANYAVLSSYIHREHLSANDFMALADKFPAKAASKLIASNLYRSLWKH